MNWTDGISGFILGFICLCSPSIINSKHKLNSTLPSTTKKCSSNKNQILAKKLVFQTLPEGFSSGWKMFTQPNQNHSNNTQRRKNVYSKIIQKFPFFPEAPQTYKNPFQALSLRLSSVSTRHRSKIETSVATCPFNKPYLPYAMNVSI